MPVALAFPRFFRVWVSSFVFLVVIALSLAPVLALAQVTASPGAAPAVATEPTLAGQLLGWVAVAALSVVTLLMGLAGAAMARRAKDSKIWGTVNSLWVLAQTVVAHVEKEIRPKVQKALEDGKLTPEEGVHLKAEALRLFREAGGKSLADLQALLGLNEGAVGTFVSGLLERALAASKPAPQGGVAVPAPAMLRSSTVMDAAPTPPMNP